MTNSLAKHLLVTKKRNGIAAVVGLILVSAVAGAQHKKPKKPLIDRLFSKESDRSVDAAWQKLADFPEDIEKISIKITRARARSLKLHDTFTDNETVFESTVDSPDICKAAARKITGVRGPNFGTYYSAWPPGTKLGTMTFFSKNDDETLVIMITNAGFYLSEDFDPRLKFHSWRLAKILNDAALEHGTSLTQYGFNLLSGAGWIVRDQHEELKFDKEKYYSRAAKIWNFLPDEVISQKEANADGNNND